MGEEEITKMTELTELQTLENYLSKPSPSTKREFSAGTKKSYVATYNKLVKLLKTDIHLASQKRILEIIDELNFTPATQSSYINVAIIIRTLYKYDTAVLAKQRDNNKTPIAESSKIKNENLSNSLPSYDDLINHLNVLYSEENWSHFIINYLLVMYGVRNADVNVEIVSLKRDAVNLESNYIWMQKSGHKAIWIRNFYKTVGNYGAQEIEITDEKFLRALKNVKNKVLLPNNTNVGALVKSLTLNGIGEGSIFKILIDNFKTDLNKLKELSEYRGTSLETIISSYNLNKKTSKK